MHVKIVFLVILKINFWMFVKFKVLIRSPRSFSRLVMQVPFFNFTTFCKTCRFWKSTIKIANFAIFKAVFNPGHFS